MQMTPSPFLYSEVTSNSPLVGASAIYTFTLTLSVDTDVNSVIMITLPPEIQVDTSRNLTCFGLLSLAGSNLRCTNKNNKQLLVYVWGD